MCATFAAVMKLTCVTILFICTVAASFSNWLVIASFNLNQQYIAKQLCINRNNPNSTCKGHCYLCKQLNKAEKPEGNNGGSKEKFEVQLFFVDTKPIQASQVTTEKIVYTVPKPFTSQYCLKSFFHPPSA